MTGPIKTSCTLFVLAFLTSSCATTSHYYLPVDPGLAKEAHGSCVPVKHGLAVIPLPGDETLYVSIEPQNGHVLVHATVALSIGQRLRLGGSSIRLDVQPTGPAFDAQLSAWRSTAHKKGGALAHDETVAIGETIEGKDWDPGDGAQRTPMAFSTTGEVEAPAADAFLVTLPAIEASGTLVAPRSFLVKRHEDTTHYECFQ